MATISVTPLSAVGDLIYLQVIISFLCIDGYRISSFAAVSFIILNVNLRSISSARSSKIALSLLQI